MEPVNVTASMDMTPYKILSMNIDPGLGAVRDAAGRDLSMRNWRLQNATDFSQKQALLGQEIQAKKELSQQEIQSQKDIAQWHEKVANIREDTMNEVWDKRIQAQASAASAAEKTRLKSLSDAELEREARSYATGQTDQRTGLYVPPIPRLANETTSDYVVRAATERAKEGAKRDGMIQKNTALLSGRISKIMEDSEKQNQSAAKASGLSAVNQVVSLLKPGAQQTFRAGLQKLTASGLPVEQALAQLEQLNPAFVGVADAYNEKYANTLIGARSLKNPIMETHMESLGGLLKNPAALARDDFGTLLDEHPVAAQGAGGGFALAPKGGTSATPAVNPAPQAATPSSVLGLTGINSLDQQVKSEQSQNRINDLSRKRSQLLSMVENLNGQIKTAVANPNMVVPAYGGGMGAVMPQTMPSYPDATSRAKAVLGFQSELAPVQDQLRDVNQLLGSEFQ